MANARLEKLLNEREETTAERVRKAVLEDENRFEDVYGIRDVKENLMNALEQASLISRQGYVPIILLRGPSGSGKTELINSVVRSYKRYSVENRIFTLKIHGLKCPYNENPYNIYRTILPITLKIDRDRLTNAKRPEICQQCERNLETSLEENTDKEKNADNIELEAIFPQSAVAEFGDNVLSPTFINIVKNSNRAILTISADKSRIEEINPKAFQILNNIYDNNLSDTLGNRIPLDSLIIIHSNEAFTELSDDDTTELRPLMERIIRVDVRRNLSYSEEEKIAGLLGLPFKRIVPHGLEYISKFNVLSRLHTEKGIQADNIDNVLDLLDYYDSSNLSKLEKAMTESMSRFLSGINPNYKAYDSIDNKDESRFLKDTAKQFILNESGYLSGWSDGVSPRSINDILVFNYSTSKPKDSLSFSDIENYITRNEPNVVDGKGGVVKNYIDHKIVNDVSFGIEYALLYYYFGDHFNDYTNAIARYVNHLIKQKPKEEFEDVRGYLSEANTYFDVNRIAEHIGDFKGKKVPLGLISYTATFEDLLHFSIEKDQSLVKKESKFYQFIGDKSEPVDKNSDMYTYINKFLKERLGYFEEAIEEAFNIYKEKTLFYDK